MDDVHENKTTKLVFIPTLNEEPFHPREWEVEEEEAISRMKADELDELVASGEIREIDREHVTFIVRTIVHPPEWREDPRSKKSDT